jgi:hypothetical protein
VRGGVGVQPQLHQRALPPVGLRQRRRCLAETLAPVGPQGPPARRAARLVTLSRGSLLWITGTSCAAAGISCSRKKHTACHNRAPSRQSSDTKHLRRDDRERQREIDSCPIEGASTSFATLAQPAVRHRWSRAPSTAPYKMRIVRISLSYWRRQTRSTISAVTQKVRLILAEKRLECLSRVD